MGEWFGRSSQTVWLQRSANTFVFGDHTEVQFASIGLDLNSSSADAFAFLSRSRKKERYVRPTSSRSEVRLHATWPAEAMTGLPPRWVPRTHPPSPRNHSVPQTRLPPLAPPVVP